MSEFQLLLPIGAFALYLFDSVLLLYSNELVLQGGGPRWSFSGGSDWFLFRRRIHVPNPLLPQRPIYKVYWLETDSYRGGETSEDLLSFKKAIVPIQITVIFLLTQLLITLPLTSLLLGAGTTLLVVFVMFYGVIIAALWWAYRRRVDFCLTKKTYWALVVDVLACAPFAVNLVRKLSLNRSIAGDPMAFAKMAMDPESYESLSKTVGNRVDSELAAVEPNSKAAKDLEDFRKRLQDTLS